ncbi:hypothetical protein KY330_00790 [Candidatus Woesearchaeota archaeon]|nr:hypothetical protein [Candidatus Woesearchaeota archaeon]
MKSRKAQAMILITVLAIVIFGVVIARVAKTVGTDENLITRAIVRNHKLAAELAGFAPGNVYFLNTGNISYETKVVNNLISVDDKNAFIVSKTVLNEQLGKPNQLYFVKSGEVVDISTNFDNKSLKARHYNDISLGGRFPIVFVYKSTYPQLATLIDRLKDDLVKQNYNVKINPTTLDPRDVVIVFDAVPTNNEVIKVYFELNKDKSVQMKSRKLAVLLLNSMLSEFEFNPLVVPAYKSNLGAYDVAVRLEIEQSMLDKYYLHTPIREAIIKFLQ